MKLVTDGLPGDNDEEGWSEWLESAFTEQAISSIPLVGKEAMLLYEKWAGRYTGTQYSALVAPFEKALEALKIIGKEDKEESDKWRASGYALEALSLGGVMPLPVTEIKRTGRAINLLMNEEDKWEAARTMMGMYW
jgi:hypothetical protein